MNYIFMEEERARKTLSIEKKTCDCIQRTSYGLPCACFIAMKIRHNKPIRLDEIHPHWHKLYMGEEESNEDLFSVVEEWSVTQKSFIPNETRNQRGFAVVSVSGDHNVVTISKKGANQRSKGKKKSNLLQKRHVGSHLRRRLLILNIWKVNLHHQKNLHNVKQKVLALAFLRFRFLSLA